MSISCENILRTNKNRDILTDSKTDVFEKNDAVFLDRKFMCIGRWLSKETHESTFEKYPKGQIADYVINDDKVYFVVNYDIYHEFSHTVHIFEYDLVDLSLKDIYKFDSLLQNIQVFYHNDELYISAYELEDENELITGWRLSSLDLSNKKETVLYSIKDANEIITTGFKQCGDLFEWLEISKRLWKQGIYPKYYDTVIKQ
jgi:hypothetical protein